MNQFYVICFDIADKKRLRKVSTQMENFGTRVQYSVFECYLDSNELKALMQRITDLIDPGKDHVRYYGLCDKDLPKVLCDGIGTLTQDNDYHLF